MAIKWNDGTTTHEGCVIGDEFMRVDRVMSDIYANTYHVYVFLPSEKKVTTIQVSSAFELDNRRGDWTADLVGGPYEDDYNEYLAEQERKNEEYKRLKAIQDEKDRQEGAKRRLLTPRKGMSAKVVKGRKVPRGTEGVIIWVGDNGYGEKVGIKEPNGAVHWTATSNVEVKGFGLDYGEEPADGWVALEVSIQEAKRKADEASSLPMKGHEVREKKNPANRGKIFWVKGERIGFKKNRKANPTWANMSEVQVLVEGSWEEYVKVEATLPGDESKTDANPPLVEERKSAILDMPEPFCHIKQIVQREDGMWEARDGQGGLITLLPETTALELSGLL